jgi:hypothetical protein
MPPASDPIITTCAVRSIDDKAQIIFLRNIGTFLDQKPVDFLASRTSLLRNKGLAQEFRRILPDFIKRLSASLTPPALPRPPAWI